MALISHVGYLKRGTSLSMKSSTWLAVLFDGELSLFPCNGWDTEILLDPTKHDGPPAEVMDIRGAVMFTSFQSKHENSCSFTIVGSKSRWKGNFVAKSREEALIWIARLRDESESEGVDDGILRHQRRSMTTLCADGEHTPDTFCPSVAHLVDWMRSVKDKTPDSTVIEPSPKIRPQRIIAQRRLACLQEQLREREFLLKQIEDREKQFGKDRINHCRFATTARTNFCLVPGDSNTQVRCGDKVVVFGLKDNMTWRCHIDRQVQAVLCCQKNGTPGYDVVHTDCAGRTSQDSMFSLVPQHGSRIGATHQCETVAEEDGSGADAQSLSSETSVNPFSGKRTAALAQTGSAHPDLARTDSLGSSKSTTSGGKATPTALDTPRAPSAGNAESPSLVISDGAPPKPSRPSRASGDGTSAARSETPPKAVPTQQEDARYSFGLAVSAKQFTYPLIGSLSALETLNYVVDEASEVLAMAHLTRPSSPSPSSQNVIAGPTKNKIRSIARRLTSSTRDLTMFRSTSRNSLSGPEALARGRRRCDSANALTLSSIEPERHNHRLPKRSVSSMGYNLAASILDRQGGSTQTSASRRKSSASELGPRSMSAIDTFPRMDSDSLQSEIRGQAAVARMDEPRIVLDGPDTDLESSSDDSDVPRLRRPTSDSSFDDRSNIDSPIYRGIVNSLKAGSRYGMSRENFGNLPSQSAVNTLIFERKAVSEGGSLRTSSNSTRRTSIVSAMSGFSTPPDSVSAWDAESEFNDLENANKVRIVQFDWPSPGLHLADFWVNKSSEVSGKTDNSVVATQMVIISHIDSCCSANATSAVPGDAILNINEHSLSKANTSARKAWDILNGITSTSVRLVLLPMAGLRHMELNHRRTKLEGQLFMKQFCLWRLNVTEETLRAGQLTDPDDSSEDEGSLV